MRKNRDEGALERYYRRIKEPERTLRSCTARKAGGAFWLGRGQSENLTKGTVEVFIEGRRATGVTINNSTKPTKEENRK